MGLVSVIELMSDPDFCQSFIIERSAGGSWQAGKWVNNITEVPSYGAMQPASPRDKDMVPEGDRITGLVAVWSSSPIFTTGTTGVDDAAAHISDIIIWHGQRYTVLGVKPWFDDGYWRAVATRMAGQ